MSNTENNSLAAAAESARIAKLDRMHTEIRELAEAISEVDNAVIPESVYIEYFLEYFRDPVKYADTPLRAKWTELAGNVYSEVDVLDVEGAVLFTVPGLLPQQYSKLTDTSIDYAEIIAKYRGLLRVSEVQAEQYLTTSLSTASSTVHADIAMHVARHNSIIARYDKLDTGVNPTVNTPVSHTKIASAVSPAILDL